MMSIREGDVLKYTPATDWCNEGLAMVHRSVISPTGFVVIDTYWQTGLSPDFTDGHRLSDEEMAGAEVLFNVSDYSVLAKGPNCYTEKVSEEWHRYAPEDRERVTSQHGLSVVYLVKKGAERSHRAHANRLKARIEGARRELCSAQNHLKSLEEELRAHEASAVQTH